MKTIREMNFQITCENVLFVNNVLNASYKSISSQQSSCLALFHSLILRSQNSERVRTLSKATEPRKG